MQGEYQSHQVRLSMCSGFVEDAAQMGSHGRNRDPNFFGDRFGVGTAGNPQRHVRLGPGQAKQLDNEIPCSRRAFADQRVSVPDAVSVAFERAVGRVTQRLFGATVGLGPPNSCTRSTVSNGSDTTEVCRMKQVGRGPPLSRANRPSSSPFGRIQSV
jgi:hypothetical protein